MHIVKTRSPQTCNFLQNLELSRTNFLVVVNVEKSEKNNENAASNQLNVAYQNLFEEIKSLK